MMICTRAIGLFAAACLFGTAGCQKEAPAPAPEAPPPAASTADDHGHEHAPGETAHGGHGAGPHDGTLADWGGGKYHVEFTVDHDKQEAIVYILGSDEKTPAPVTTADGKLLLTINEPAFQVELTAQPMDGETEGASSRYVGTHENLGKVQDFEIGRASCRERV